MTERKPTIVQREWLRTARRDGVLPRFWPAGSAKVNTAMIWRVVEAGWAEWILTHFQITDAGRAALGEGKTP